MFNHLHVHDAKGSILDSILKVEDIAKFAHDNGMKAIAITNHGMMTSYVDFVKECKKYDIKPIIGNEIYEVDDMYEKADTKDYRQQRYHLVLLASTQQGYQNLLKITSVSCTEGMYKKPRIDMNYIKSNNLGKGIVCLTACQAGRVSRLLEMGHQTGEYEKYNEEAYSFVKKLQSIFDYVAVEIQSHATQSQILCNRLIYEFTLRYKLPYVITTDAHMLNADLLESHSMFVSIGEGREAGESYVDCYLQTEEDIYRTMGSHFSKYMIKKGIEETQNIVDVIENIDIGLNKGNIMPQVQIEDGFDSHEDYLRHLVFKSFNDKFGHMSQEDKDIRKNRLEMELPVLYTLEYTDYFIMLYMLAKEARKRKIPIGYSRGSGANCLCLFMLNVTQIDSVRWDLDFSRFANLGRRSIADFDWDISKRRRKEMIEISEELFGKLNVAPIATFNTLSTKVAIRDIGKVLNEREDSPYKDKIPYSLRNEVAKMIPTIKTLNDLGEEEEKDTLLKDILFSSEKLQKVYYDFPLWFKYVMDVEGLPKSIGRHAAGTLITPKEIDNYCPLCFDSDKNIMIQLEMHNAMDDLGLVKMDYLGLETLDIIDDTLKNAGISWDDVDINHLDLNDKDVFEQVYKTGNTVGIFQMESAEAKKMCIEANVDNVEDVIVINAANRPGTKDSFPTYCFNKLNPDKVEVLHDDLKVLFGKTHFILLYQEQALQLFRHASFQEDQVDNARRCVDKSTLITMGDGNRKKIKDIQVGEFVSCLNEQTGAITYKPVKNVFNNGIKQTYKINTVQDNEIIATKDHKVLTQDGWKKVEELTTDDYLMTPKRLHAFSDDIPSKYKPHSDLMFLLGLLIGDGCLIEEKRIHFTNSEECLVNEYKRCVNMLSRKKEPCEFYDGIVDGVTVDKIYSVYIESKEYNESLIKLCKKYDMLHRAGEKQIPKEFMQYPIGNLLTKFIAGLFNTDGGYNISNTSIEYYTTSKMLAYQLESLLLKYNIKSYVASKDVKGYDYRIYTLMIKDIESLKRFDSIINKHVIGRKHDDYKNILDLASKRELQYSYILPDKYYNEISTQYKNHGFTFSTMGENIGGYKYNGFKITKNARLTDTKARELVQMFYCPKTYKLLTSEYIPVKIKSIELFEERNVYDIEVETNHNYIANGLIVHNCIGKKDKEKMKTLEIDFRKGLSEKSWDDKQLSSIWQLMLKQSEYCFNRGHAVAYGLLSYLTAYLKVHYTIYFMSALLTSKSDKVQKISFIINDCKRLGIKVSPPNVNISNSYFTAIPEKSEILFGLQAIKGMGESVVNKILEQRPYKGLNDLSERLQDKSAVITLIKCGAIPTNNKMKSLQKYATLQFPKREYKDVTTTPSPYIKLLDYGIDVNNYREGRKVDKDRLLKDYNNIRREMFNKEQSEKYKKYMEEFFVKYAMDEYLWEFQTLSMFLTHDPLESSYKYLGTLWDDIDDGEKAVLLCVIVDIKRKKDKHNNQFAYLDLYTPFGIIEATIWSSQLKTYSELVEKGKCLAILGRKNDGGHFFVEKMRPYNQWLNDMTSKKKGVANG